MYILKRIYYGIFPSNKKWPDIHLWKVDRYSNRPVLQKRNTGKHMLWSQTILGLFATWRHRICLESIYFVQDNAPDKWTIATQIFPLLISFSSATEKFTASFFLCVIYTWSNSSIAIRSCGTVYLVCFIYCRPLLDLHLEKKDIFWSNCDLFHDYNY